MKPTLLLLHGALGSPATLEPLAELLAADFTVKTFAFAGHGGREVHPETFALPQFAQEVLAFLQAHETGPAHVFGYSMGGYAALLAARQEPARFAGITTLGTKLDWSPESAAAETRFLDPEKMQAKVPAFAEQLRQRHAPADWTAVVRATASLMTAAGAQPPLAAADFAALHVPVQVLMGDGDLTPERGDASRQLAEQLPQMQYAVLPNTPHPIERVNIPDLANRIRTFAWAHS
ncbi:alpha/beta fold hydrolase [Hymenobacter properus]|uniref:Alpha/beta fold hydrolase n=1 Tax=Hymenobacter properus TaxID=2791026 RepID=A0A931FM01_9BACT|nr:alpha/beta fold hydrolase [Hymenobacter properus]MBF9141194.1 alpha/beta fold hydrolase [Hymenobacter properus]MBR7720003.1 alpha/beta fold hydrolase [Microvirga sp. SRT04]